VEEAESIDCLLYAFENGIASLDTSPSYSRSEEFVGKALRRWNGPRPFISTKVGRLPAEDAYDCKLDYSPAAMRKSVKRSLDLLGVERVDILFLHEPQCVPLDKIEEITDTLLSFKAEGLTRRLGIGGNPTDDFRARVKKGTFQVMSGFCMLDACNLTALEKDIPFCQQNDIAYYAASSLHFALLGNRFETYCREAPGGDYISDKDIKTAIRTKAIAEKYGMDLANMSQRYLFSMEEATRITMGARKISQIENTIRDWKQGVLPEEIFNEITEMVSNR
jgi:aryl-alcohol dehydrogenase-like predicted oxidoreductase